MRTVGKIRSDDVATSAQYLLSPTLVTPVPESVGGWGGFHVEFRHWHSPRRHLGRKHGGRINHGGSSHLRSKRRETDKWPHYRGKKHSFRKHYINSGRFAVTDVREAKQGGINGALLRDRWKAGRHPFSWSLEECAGRQGAQMERTAEEWFGFVSALGGDANNPCGFFFFNIRKFKEEIDTCHS